MTGLSTPREPTWNDINGRVGDIGDALAPPPQRETTAPSPIPPGPEPTKTRPPQASLLTARFEDLDGHLAFSQHFNATLVGFGLARTRDKHTRGRIRGMDG